jgi:chaperone modulatory protein CbpM
MMDMREYLDRANCQQHVLAAWVEAGWVIPTRTGGAWYFEEVDLARAQLIGDLQKDFGVNDEGVSLVLDLVDQLFGLRRTLRNLAGALQAQPENVRTGIALHLREGLPPPKS